MNHDIGKKLVALRGNRSRKEVAKAVGVSHSAIQMYECGYRVPRDFIKKKLSVYYGVPVEELFFTFNDTKSV